MTNLESDARDVMEQSKWQSQGICKWVHYVPIYFNILI